MIVLIEHERYFDSEGSVKTVLSPKTSWLYHLASSIGMPSAERSVYSSYFRLGKTSEMNSFNQALKFMSHSTSQSNSGLQVKWLAQGHPGTTAVYIQVLSLLHNSLSMLCSRVW